jgi:hypothetical protein
MTDAKFENFKWFAAARQEQLFPPQEQYIDMLAHIPHKVDILLRVDNIAALVQSDVMERLAQHPKVGTLIIHGLPKMQRPLVTARAAMLGLHIRFCESEDEARMLRQKRRSRSIVNGNL